MSSDEEDLNLEYGINDQFGKSFGADNEHEGLDEHIEKFDSEVNDFEVPKYEKNPRINLASEEKDEGDVEVDEDEDCPLEDLLNLMEKENEEGEPNTEQKGQRKKILIKKDKTSPKATQASQKNETNSIEKSPKTATKKSSITISKLDKPDEDKILTEKHSGLRLIKSSFNNEIELNLRLACDYGKFLKLTEIHRRFYELKDKGSSLDWFTVFVLASKTEPKCSAKGNNYVIWRLVDLNNLEKQQEISLFLFGNAYKTHWKSSEFQVFALIKPDLLDSGQKSEANKPAAPNNYLNSQVGKKAAKQGSSWNNFAVKKMSLDIKLNMSVKSESQLVPLGYSKDVNYCQGSKQPNESDQSKKCKNFVNLQEVAFCIYHCKQLDGMNKFSGAKGKFSMNKPATTSRFDFVSSPDVKMVPVNRIPDPFNKYNQHQEKSKICKDIRAEILQSLNGSVSQIAAPILSNVVFKSEKKSDKELLALLDGKQLNRDELRKIRLEQQAVVSHQRNDNDQNRKEISKLFTSKVLLPSEATCNRSVSSMKYLELKSSQSAPNSPGGDKLRENYENNKKNFNLAKMSSHKEIVKEIKEKKKNATVDDDEESKKEDAKPIEPMVQKDNKIKAFDFLKKRVNEISKPQVEKPAPSVGFDLELYIGDSLTSKKLLDANSKYIPFSASTATSTGYKRKLDEMKKSSGNTPTKPEETEETCEEKKAKKAKMFDEILSIKSNHRKDANDPEKNPHVKAYFDKLEQQEGIDNKLCSTKSREVKAVTCATCQYTSFAQSDYCKKQTHSVKRHQAVQRFFKCKICSKRTWTLDKVCPISSCSQCGNNKFEPCGMKAENYELGKDKAEAELNIQSEMLNEN